MNILKQTLAVIIIVTTFYTSCNKQTDNTYPLSGLVSYFKFDDDLKDVLKNTPTGVNIGGAPFVDGVRGKAISVNGEDQIIEFNRSRFNKNDQISVAFWFKKSTSEGLHILRADDFDCTAIVSGESGVTSFVISLPSTSSATGTYTLGAWTHFVGTYDGNDIKIYINGSLVDEVSHPGNISFPSPSKKLTIGRSSDDKFNSVVMDDLLIYNRVLSADEVEEIYNVLD